MSGSVGPYREAWNNMQSKEYIEEFAGELTQRLNSQEAKLLSVIADGDKATYGEYKGSAAVAAAQAALQRLQRVWAGVQSILQSRHQMLMEAIRNIGR